jgi:hypothetical protein
VCTQFEQLVRRTQTKLVIDFRQSPGLLLAGESTGCGAERERQLLRAALLRGVERRQGQLKEVRVLHLAHCQPQLQLVELVASLLRGQLRALHIGRAPQPLERAAAKTAVHQSLELLLECRWVAYHTPLQALTLTHCTSCPPLGQLQALERLRLQCCGYPDAPLALPFDILRLKRLRSLGLWDTDLSWHVLLLLPQLELEELHFCRSTYPAGSGATWLQGLTGLRRLHLSGLGLAAEGTEPRVDQVAEALWELTQVGGGPGCRPAWPRPCLPASLSQPFP